MTKPISSSAPTFLDVCIKFCDERAKDVAKAFTTAIQWLGVANPHLPPQVKEFSAFTGNVKNFLGATEVPRKMQKLWSSIKECGTNLAGAQYNKIAKSARKAIKDGAALTNSLFDGVSLGNKFAPISSQVMKGLGVVNAGATVVGSSLDTVDQAEGIIGAKENEEAKKTLHLINIARNLSYVALGALMLYSFITATAIAPLWALAFATSGFLFTVGGFFYEKMHEPQLTGSRV